MQQILKYCLEIKGDFFTKRNYIYIIIFTVIKILFLRYEQSKRYFVIYGETRLLTKTQLQRIDF